MASGKWTNLFWFLLYYLIAIPSLNLLQVDISGYIAKEKVPPFSTPMSTERSYDACWLLLAATRYLFVQRPGKSKPWGPNWSVFGLNVCRQLNQQKSSQRCTCDYITLCVPLVCVCERVCVCSSLQEAALHFTQNWGASKQGQMGSKANVSCKDMNSDHLEREPSGRYPPLDNRAVTSWFDAFWRIHVPCWVEQVWSSAICIICRFLSRFCSRVIL